MDVDDALTPRQLNQEQEVQNASQPGLIVSCQTVGDPQQGLARPTAATSISHMRAVSVPNFLSFGIGSSGTSGGSNLDDGGGSRQLLVGGSMSGSMDSDQPLLPAPGVAGLDRSSSSRGVIPPEHQHFYSSKSQQS